MDVGAAQARFAATLVSEWVARGLAHAVVAPGSRSTPMAVALDSHDGVTVHVLHDERAAGFCAIGLARTTGRAAVVVTTSGTAAVHPHAAAVEADLSRVPLIVVTADRPAWMRGRGAPQTIDQRGLYGSAVRAALDPGVPDSQSSARWPDLAAQAWSHAHGRPPGPVHLNLAFDEPLDTDAAPFPIPARVDAAPEGSALPLTPWDPGTTRGVVLAGRSAHPPERVRDLARRLGWPILATVDSGLRGPGAVGAVDAVARTWPAALRPDLALRIGAPSTSRALSEALAAGTFSVAAVTEPDGFHADPEGRVSEVLAGWPEISAPGAPASWPRAWADLEERVQQTLDRELGQGWSEPAIARRVLADAAGSDRTVVLSSSMPVRDAEWYGPSVPVDVHANRGANGIDGVTATAIGVALAGRPTTLLTGDLAFLHDSTALIGLAGRVVDLHVVVIDNRGGGIFSFLPQAERMAPERFERLMGTPHGTDLVALARAHGVAARSAEGLGDLAPRSGAGPEVVVATSDRAENRLVHDRLNAALAAVIDGFEPRSG